MRTAVVHDWLNGMRGGEKVLEAILPLVPEPTIFTLFHVPGSVSPAIERHPIRASSLNRLPFARRTIATTCPSFRGRSSPSTSRASTSSSRPPIASPRARSRRREFPTSAIATRRCATPTSSSTSTSRAGRTRLCALKAAAIARLRAWDVATASRPTRYLANSSAVADRIRRHYGREAAVVHPPVDVDFFHPPGRRPPRGDFLLAVGALVPYKRYEAAIEAARRLGRRLVLVGRGPEEARLRAVAAAPEPPAP